MRLKMKKFTDLEGREWRVSLNGWTLQQVMENTNVLLTKIVEDNCKILAAIHEDPLLLVSILWWMVEDQAEEEGVCQKDFAMALAGDVIFNAKHCLLEEITDFFDDPATRRNVRTMLEKTQNIAKLIQQESATTLEAINPESMANTFISSYGNMRESVASSPGSTH